MMTFPEILVSCHWLLIWMFLPWNPLFWPQWKMTNSPFWKQFSGFLTLGLVETLICRVLKGDPSCPALALGGGSNEHLFRVSHVTLFHANLGMVVIFSFQDLITIKCSLSVYTSDSVTIFGSWIFINLFLWCLCVPSIHGPNFNCLYFLLSLKSIFDYLFGPKGPSYLEFLNLFNFMSPFDNHQSLGFQNYSPKGTCCSL